MSPGYAGWMAREARWRLLALLLVSGFSTPVAGDPITSRDYAIELYEGVAIGDSALIGMGGAGAARALGSAGALLNPSAPVIRRATDNDRWSWDYHLDLLTARYSSDYDNNGTPTSGNGAQLATLGASLRIGTWAVSLTGIGQAAPLDGSEPALTATTTRVKLAVAHRFERAQLAVGFAAQTVRFAIATNNAAAQALFAIEGVGAVIGATWLPRGANVRAGLAIESRIVGAQVQTEGCDPENCQGFILPTQIEAPGRTILGVAYRWAASPWNQQVASEFLDERSLTVAADLVVSGTSSHGNGLEAFGQMQLQPAGRNYTASPRVGIEVEPMPGRLRLRTGSYWEPGRFEGVGGRVHATLGFEVRALEFRLWGLRRGRLGTTFDFAARYRNLGLSIGFWH